MIIDSHAKIPNSVSGATAMPALRYITFSSKGFIHRFAENDLTFQPLIMI